MDKKDDEKRTVGERHIFTKLIIQLLATVDVGEIITYEKLEAEIGMSCRPQAPGYGYQYTARAILEREEDMVFEAVTNVGLKRLPPEDVALSSVQCVTKPIKSHLRRQSRRINTLNSVYENLSSPSRFCVDAARTLIVFAKSVTSKKSIDRIESEVRTSNKQISLDDTLNLFMPKEKR